MSTMIEDRGAEYVAQWPEEIARKLRCGVGWVTTAISEVTGVRVTEMDGFTGAAAETVGTLTATQAQEVIVRVRRSLAAIAAREATHCRFCGLRLNRNGRCDECV